MRKLLILSTFIAVITLLLFSQPIKAASGEICRAAGYDCIVPDQCLYPNQSLGMVDCPQGGVLGGTICCGIPRNLSCGDKCFNAVECPNNCQACQQSVVGGDKICRVAGEILFPGEIIKPVPCGAKTGGEGILTAIGCVPTEDLGSFTTWLLGYAIGIAGVIAILLMIFGGILMILSAGDPKRLQSGRTIFTSAIIGLLFIIFSVFILRLIGVEILGIPDFG